MNSIIPKGGHRWTTEELRELINMWVRGDSLHEISEHFDVSQYAINKQVQRMRNDGVPVPRRKAGGFASRRSKSWTQEEVEYLIRRRNDQATSEQIAQELGRTFQGIQGMIQVLRKEGVPVEMVGQGCRKRWDATKLKAAIVGRELVPLKIVSGGK